jgi:hypothetical protein
MKTVFIYDLSHSVLLRMQNILDKGFRENRAIYEIMWKNIVEPERPQMT